MFEKVKKWLKRRWFEMTHTPNSPEGLRHRARVLMEDYGYSKKHPSVSMLLKRADLVEEKQ